MQHSVTKRHLLRAVVDRDDEVAHWVCSRLPTRITPEDLGPLVTIGLVDKNGKLVAGCLYHNYRKYGSMEVTFASITPRWVLPWNLAPLFHYPFVQRACTRITLIIGSNNKVALRTNIRLGFKLEGVVRRGYDGMQDAYVLGMLREECKWIAAPVATGKKKRRKKKRRFDVEIQTERAN